MSTNTDQLSKQFETMLLGPTRAFMGLGMDHLEKLIHAQLEATKAYTELGLQQARAALEIKEPKDWESYAKSQQEIAKTFGERVKGDTETAIALNRELAEKTQQLAQKSASGFGTPARQ